MEGLLPMVYKAIKKTRTRRQYECLSSSQSYNIADFYVVDGRDMINYSQSQSSNTSTHHHRRHNSVGDYAFGPENRMFGHEGRYDHDRDIAATKLAPTRARLVRFRSHRMFSCVGGAA